jgi:hypothetical protein
MATSQADAGTAASCARTYRLRAAPDERAAAEAGKPCAAIGDAVQMTDDDAPLTLVEACQRELRGTCTVSTLRAAIDRGELVAFKLGRRLCTTRAHLERWIEQCRVEPKDRASISTRRARSGSSETETDSSAQAALRELLGRPKRRSPTTSGASTARNRARHLS